MMQKKVKKKKKKKKKAKKNAKKMHKHKTKQKKQPHEFVGFNNDASSRRRASLGIVNPSLNCFLPLLVMADLPPYVEPRTPDRLVGQLVASPLLFDSPLVFPYL